jgi:hypothetical protein
VLDSVGWSLCAPSGCPGGSQHIVCPDVCLAVSLDPHHILQNPFPLSVNPMCVMLQLRHALALATILGRTLILPRLWCGLDRYWAPHAGTIPGARTTLPFACPADHVLRLEGELTAIPHHRVKLRVLIPAARCSQVCGLFAHASHGMLARRWGCTCRGAAQLLAAKDHLPYVRGNMHGSRGPCLLHTYPTPPFAVRRVGQAVARGRIRPSDHLPGALFPGQPCHPGGGQAQPGGGGAMHG